MIPLCVNTLPFLVSNKSNGPAKVFDFMLEVDVVLHVYVRTTFICESMNDI